jgi:hypothetical protein
VDLSNLPIRLLGGHNNPPSHKVPWHQLDLTDPARPRLKCDADELEPLEPVGS